MRDGIPVPLPGKRPGVWHRVAVRVCGVIGMFLLLPVAIAGPADAVQLERVSANVYAVTTPAANSGFVIGRDGVLVIDSGNSEAQGKAIRQAIAEVTDLPVRWIVITHAHADNALGTNALRGPKTEIFSTILAQQEIEQQRATWSARAQGDQASVPVPQSIVDAWTELNLGELKAVLWPMPPAHTPGDLVVWLPKQKTLFAGDVVTTRMPLLQDAHVQSWIQALADLEKLGVARVVPGHGTIGSGVAIQRMQDLLGDLWKLALDGQRGGQNYVDITARARTMIANRHAGHFTDFEKGLTDNINALLKQLPPVKNP